jgi:large conductance mechanosensitive channel
MWQDFKAFVMRGNVLDLAVAVVIGAAFGVIVKSFVDDIIMPPIGLALGRVDFSNLYVLLKSGTKTSPPYASLAEAKAAGAVTVNYGVFLNNVITFVVIALAVFLIVRAAMKLWKKPAPSTKSCPYCAMAIPLAATRCPNCTSQLAATGHA